MIQKNILKILLFVMITTIITEDCINKEQPYFIIGIALAVETFLLIYFFIKPIKIIVKELLK